MCYSVVWCNSLFTQQTTAYSTAPPACAAWRLMYFPPSTLFVLSFYQFLLSLRLLLCPNLFNCHNKWRWLTVIDCAWQQYPEAQPSPAWNDELTAKKLLNRFSLYFANKKLRIRLLHCRGAFLKTRNKRATTAGRRTDKQSPGQRQGDARSRGHSGGRNQRRNADGLYRAALMYFREVFIQHPRHKSWHNIIKCNMP